ncbi:hypothetical protein Tco_0733070 [Tanacetum coccineum]
MKVNGAAIFSVLLYLIRTEEIQLLLIAHLEYSIDNKCEFDWGGPNNGQAVSQLEYSRVIGYLMYVMTCTRHDIAFALSMYTSNPSTQHWQVIQRVLKYLKKTMDYRLTYIGYPLVLEGYTNAELD